tara:strand:+ start:15 stop:374 length:360 start_codon:yes stop_codon:yes gene_type:complete
MNEKLYPELTEQGEKEAQKLIDTFAKELKKVASKLMEEAQSNLYCDIVPHIESDSWSNFRNTIVNGICNYSENSSSYDFKRIRQAIYEEHKEEIDKDLNNDLLEEVKTLKRTIESIHRF